MENYFVGREAERAAFVALWDKKQLGLAIIGFSGIGKTTLLRWMQAECDAKHIPSAFVDFERIDSLRSFFRSSLRHLKNHLDAEAYNAYGQLQASWDERLHGLSIQIYQHQSSGESNKQYISLDANDALSARLADERRRERNALSEAWLSALETCCAPQLILLLDTLENLLFWEAEDQRALWNALEEAHRLLPHLRVVAAGRNTLPDMLREVKLGNLSTDESEALLVHLGLSDAAFRTAVYERLAHGHPGVTHFAALAWEEAKKQSIQLEDPPHISEIEKAIEWIQTKIIARLPEPYRSILAWMPLLRSFTLEALNAILELTAPIDQDQLLHLTKYAMLSYSSGLYHCHDLLSDVQTGYQYAQQPQAWRALHQRAYAYWSKYARPTHEPEQNLALYHRLLVDPEHGVQQWRTALLNTEQKHRSAASLLKMAEQNRPYLPVVQRGEIDLALAHYLRRSRQIQAAKQAYDRALRALDGHADRLIRALHGRAIVAAQLGDHEEARDLFKQGTQADPHHAPLWQAWALMEKDLRNYDTARDLFKQGTQADPHHAPLWQAWALMEKDLRNYDTARDLFKQGTQADPYDPATWQAWALMEKDLRNYDTALRLVGKVFECEPSSPYGYDARGQIRAAMGDYQGARQDYERALQHIEERLKHPMPITKRRKWENLRKRVQQRLGDLPT